VARAPTAGGQYHWVSEFAPRTIQKPLSYIVGMLSRKPKTACMRSQLCKGWLCATGWQVFLASVAFIVGTIIQGLIVLNNEKYEYQAWHGTLLAIAVISFSIIFNTLLATRLPLVEGIVLVIHVTGLFAIIIPLWVLSPRGNAYDVLLTFTNNGGWPSTGLSAMIGLASPFSSLLGYDCSVHMCRPAPVLRRTSYI
jgi:choline transport protein